jgi:hypothetical protein
MKNQELLSFMRIPGLKEIINGQFLHSGIDQPFNTSSPGLPRTIIFLELSDTSPIP